MGSNTLKWYQFVVNVWFCIFNVLYFAFVVGYFCLKEQIQTFVQWCHGWKRFGVLVPWTHQGEHFSCTVNAKLFTIIAVTYRICFSVEWWENLKILPALTCLFGRIWKYLCLFWATCKNIVLTIPVAIVYFHCLTWHLFSKLCHPTQKSQVINCKMWTILIAETKNCFAEGLSVDLEKKFNRCKMQSKKKCPDSQSCSEIFSSCSMKESLLIFNTNLSACCCLACKCSINWLRFQLLTDLPTSFLSYTSLHFI